MPERDGIRTFVDKIIQSGVGTTTVILAVPGKRLVLRSAFLVCDADQIGTWGLLQHYPNDCDRHVAQVLALKGTHVLYDASSPPLPGCAVNEALKLAVQAVKATTNGFADLNAWIYGTYELET